jgi:transketolase
MRAQLVTSLKKIMHDERFMLLLCDIGEYAFRELKNEYPGRVINLGISEQAAVGVAAGLAIEGKYPILYVIAPFLVERAYEQIKLDLAAHGLPAILITVGGSYDYSHEGKSHHCPAEIGLLLNIPGMTILTPGTAMEMNFLLTQAALNPGLYALRLSERCNAKTNMADIGRAVLIRHVPGAKVITLVAAEMLDRTLAALGDQPTTIIYYQTASPFDARIIRKWQGLAQEILIIEPWYTTLVIPVAEALSCITIRNVSVPRRFIDISGTPEQIDAAIGLDTDGILRAYKELENG